MRELASFEYALSRVFPYVERRGGAFRRERFRWLVSTRSSGVQVSAARWGLCADSAGMLDGIVARMAER